MEQSLPYPTTGELKTTWRKAVNMYSTLLPEVLGMCQEAVRSQLQASPVPWSAREPGSQTPDRIARSQTPEGKGFTGGEHQDRHLNWSFPVVPKGLGQSHPQGSLHRPQGPG